jgi:hypothetical protein
VVDDTGRRGRWDERWVLALLLAAGVVSFVLVIVYG